MDVEESCLACVEMGVCLEELLAGEVVFLEAQTARIGLCACSFLICWHSVLKRATLDTPSTFLLITRRTSLWPPPRSRMHMRGRAVASVGPYPLSCGSPGVFSGPMRAPSAL